MSKWYVGQRKGRVIAVQDSTGGIAAITIDDDVEANARLIAAAPELLEAAQAVIEAWGIPHGDGVLEQRMHALRAAVQKATGEGS